MDLLIIGGTKFLGPHLVEASHARGNRVTVFNRGKSGAAPAGAEWIAGDRERDLSLLGTRRWDAVVDTCGYIPRIVDASADALYERTGAYAFVSTMSVYPERFSGNADEDEAVVELEDPTVEEVTPETYGALKALCERAVNARMGDRALIVRPGLIVGPRDPSDRFTYWPNRFALGGDVLVPGPEDAPVSFIDVRDLAGFIVGALHSGVSGTFNASGTYGALTMSDVISACRAAAGCGEPVWVSEQFLLERAVTPWTELPLWIPTGESDIVRASSARAVAAGLRYRALDETVRATLAWTTQLGLQRDLRAGLTRARESELLREWRSTEPAATSQR